MRTEPTLDVEGLATLATAVATSVVANLALSPKSTEGAMLVAMQTAAVTSALMKQLFGGARRPRHAGDRGRRQQQPRWEFPPRL